MSRLNYIDGDGNERLYKLVLNSENELQRVRIYGDAEGLRDADRLAAYQKAVRSYLNADDVNEAYLAEERIFDIVSEGFEGREYQDLSLQDDTSRIYDWGQSYDNRVEDQDDEGDCESWDCTCYE